MPKIAFFSLTPSPPAPPANQMTLAALQKVFPDHQFDIFYILPELKRSPFGLATAAAVAGATYAPDLLRGRKSFKYAAFRTPWVFRWIKKRAANLINPADYAFTFQMQSLFDASVPGVPNFVYTDHTHLENLSFDGFDPADLYSPRWIDCERTIYRNAATVFTRSSNVSASLITQYDTPPDDIACVFAGSNAAIPSHVAEGPTRYAAKNILFAGVDWERKGGPTLLAAFRHLLKTHPDATLTIVGCTPDIGGTPHCNVVGRVSLDEMPKHYAQATVFCLPTSVEPFGIVFVEAMWNALPIVATDVGAVPDMVEEGVNGFLVSPGNVSDLAERLTVMLDDPARRATFGVASRRLAVDRYDWDSVADKIRHRIEETLIHAADKPARG